MLGLAQAPLLSLLGIFFINLILRLVGILDLKIHLAMSDLTNCGRSIKGN